MHGVVELAREHLIERVRCGSVTHFHSLHAGDPLVDLAHDGSGGGRRCIGCLGAFLLHRCRQFGDILIGAFGIHQQHEWLAVDGGRHLQRLGGVHRRLLEQMHVGRNGGACMHVDGIAVGLGFRRVFGGDVAAGTRAVLHDDRAFGDRPKLLGKVADQHVGAAPRGECADEMDVTRRVLLRACHEWRHAQQCATYGACKQAATWLQRNPFLGLLHVILLLLLMEIRIVPAGLCRLKTYS